jgi:hypothetical protein
VQSSRDSRRDSTGGGIYPALYTWEFVPLYTVDQLPLLEPYCDLLQPEHRYSLVKMSYIKESPFPVPSCYIRQTN